VAIIIDDSSWAFFESFLKSYDDNHISYVNVEGTIGVKKKKKTFQKRKIKALDVDVPMSRVDKFLYKESIRTIRTIVSCSLNCCQYFSCEKTTLMKDEFWKMFYDDWKV
jgi:hypothetical protein